MSRPNLPQEETIKYWLNIADRVWPTRQDLERSLKEFEKLKTLKSYQSKTLDAKIEAIRIILRNKKF